jgi:hypothetical protein
MEMPVANAVLTTIMDAGSQSWTPRCPSRSSGLIRWSAVDSRGPGHSPENRKASLAEPSGASIYPRRVTK